MYNIITKFCELEMRYKKHPHFTKLTDLPQLNSSTTAFKFVNDYFPKILESAQEHFCVIALNNSNRVLIACELFKGGTDSTIADVKIICKLLLQFGSKSCILVYNHPSGNLKPSEIDFKLTERIKQALVLLDMRLQDHLIVSEDYYYSFADEGGL